MGITQLVRSVVVLLLIALCLIAWGQGGVTSGGGGGSVEKRFNFGNQDYGFFVTGTSTDGTAITVENQKLSGTNVTINLHVGSGWAPAGTPGSESVTDAVLSDVEVYILGETAPDDEPTPNGNGPGAITACVSEYRLATTYFPHDGNIRVRVKCKFVFTYDLTEEQDLEEVINFDEYLQFKAYNVLLPLATNLNGLGQVDLHFQTVGDAATTAAATALSYSHLSNPAGGSPARAIDIDDLVTLLRDSTVMMAITHGFATGFDDPFGNSVWWDEQISFDVADRIAAKASVGIPGYNIVAFWSCGTLSAGDAPVAAFGLSGADRAYAGFTNKVAIDCWYKSTWDTSGRGGPTGPYEATLAEHAYDFWVAMQGGFTIDEALAAANTDVMPHTIDLQTGAKSMLPMERRGDGLARINFVYFTEGERQLLEGSPNSIAVWLTKLPVTGD